MYGQTEATARMSFVHPNRILDKIGSIGKPIPGGVFSLGTSDQYYYNNELIYSGPNVMMGYAENRSDLCLGDSLFGILHTGDVARVDQEGFYFLEGRLKRIVKIQGRRHNLDEIESQLIDAVGDVACTGIDDLIRVHCKSKEDFLVAQEYVLSRMNINKRSLQMILIQELPRKFNGKVDYMKLDEIIE
jgi:acyl-coenzyme A synthetase/AMP-(fatty) acid ligase